MGTSRQDHLATAANKLSWLAAQLVPVDGATLQPAQCTVPTGNRVCQLLPKPLRHEGTVTHVTPTARLAVVMTRVTWHRHATVRLGRSIAANWLLNVPRRYALDVSQRLPWWFVNWTPQHRLA